MFVNTLNQLPCKLFTSLVSNTKNLITMHCLFSLSATRVATLLLIPLAHPICIYSVLSIAKHMVMCIEIMHLVGVGILRGSYLGWVYVCVITLISRPSNTSSY